MMAVQLPMCPVAVTDFTVLISYINKIKDLTRVCSFAGTVVAGLEQCINFIFMTDL